MTETVDEREEETEEDEEDRNIPEKSATAGPTVSAHTIVPNAGNPP